MKSKRCITFVYYISKLHKTNNRESAGGYLHNSFLPAVKFEKRSVAPAIPVEFTQKSFDPLNHETLPAIPFV